jgi:hypothetical protein
VRHHRAAIARAAALLWLGAVSASAAWAASSSASFAVQVQLTTGCTNTSQVQHTDLLVVISCSGRQPVEVRQVRRGDVAGPGGWVIENRTADAALPGSNGFGPLWTTRLDHGHGFVEFLVGW